MRERHKAEEETLLAKLAAAEEKTKNFTPQKTDFSEEGIQRVQAKINFFGEMLRKYHKNEDPPDISVQSSSHHLLMPAKLCLNHGIC